MVDTLDSIADDIAAAANHVPPGVAAELVSAIESLDSAMSMLSRIAALPALVAA